MKTNINLIPEDIGGSKVVKASNLLTKVAVALTAFFIIVGTCGGIYLVVLGSQLSSTNQANNSKIVEIESLKSVEERYVLVRDRIDKIKQTLADTKFNDSINLFKNLIDGLSTDVSLSEAEIDKNLMKLTFSATNSQALVDLFSTLSQTGLFKRVYLKNFSFNKTVGYIASLEISL